MPRIVLIRQLRTAAHLGAAVARVLVASQDAPTEPVAPEAHTGYLEVQTTPQEALKAFETDAPHTPREQQSEAERAHLDTQTDAILGLLKAQQGAE
jgi:hypothetical protein